MYLLVARIARSKNNILIIIQVLRKNYSFFKVFKFKLIINTFLLSKYNSIDYHKL